MVKSFVNGYPMDRPPSFAVQDYTWYFAYGSNLSKGRIEQRTGLVPPARTACLKNHRLAFNVHAEQAIYANVVPCYESIVWGAAYWCSCQMIDALDKYEGVATGCYRRSWVEVQAENGEPLQATVYVGGGNFVADEGLPSDAYLHLILTGAKEHDLPEKYQRFLAACGSRGSPIA